MNLWFRLFWTFLIGAFRPRIKLPAGVSTLDFRTGLLDLDASLHMNNGRYLTIMDLGRLDFMARGGLMKPAIKNRWTPIASAISISFRRELRYGQKFRLYTRLLCWNETLVVMEQVFTLKGGPRSGQIAARALFKGGLYNRASRAFVSTQELMTALGISVTSPPQSPEVEAFLKAQEKTLEAAKPSTLTLSESP